MSEDMKEKLFSAALATFFAVLIVGGAIGWCRNIWKMFDAGTGEIVARVIGAFIFPVGAVMGWF